MSAFIRVEVSAEQIAAAGDDHMAWAAPVEAALAALTGQVVDIDGGGPDGPCVATIGQDEWTIVVDLPPDINAWLDARWDGRWDDAGREALTFDLDVPTWLIDLITRWLLVP